LDEALKISDETSKEILSQLPKEKVPCFTLATDALKLAIEEYRCKQAGVREKGGFDMEKD
jgi:NifU-like protein involved in Fe-S cluster formation